MMLRDLAIVGTAIACWREATDCVNTKGLNEAVLLNGAGVEAASTVTSTAGFDDVIIETLIRSARERLDEYTGLSFIPKTWEIELTKKIAFAPHTAKLDFLWRANKDLLNQIQINLNMVVVHTTIQIQ